jgi:beta-lactamase superfamily II metal-dependent hydrolase
MQMPTASPKRSLTILNVGHGNAAVLVDEGGAVVFDTGLRGTAVLRFLRNKGIREIEALYLSHSDADHLGGASTLLLDANLKVGSVYVNSDASKQTAVFEQLRYAIAEARKQRGTVTHVGLTTSLNALPRRVGTRIDVLYPAPEVAAAGVGGSELGGRTITPNSMSAVIRIGDIASASVLLCGDIEDSCLSHWHDNGEDVKAGTLVFPHHGGNPGVSNDDELQQFTELLYSLAQPVNVVFSIHKTKHSLPKQRILDTLVTQSAEITFTCTQLPEKFHAAAADSPNWRYHFNQEGELVAQADIVCDLDSDPGQLYLVVHSA